MTMDSLMHIVHEEMSDWIDNPTQTNRYSIFTEHLILADKVKKHQHLTPKPLEPSSKNSALLEFMFERDADVDRGYGSTTFVSKPASPESLKPDSECVPVTVSQNNSKPSNGGWDWRPCVPHRVSSMSTRGKKSGPDGRPDLATFHRRSCQLFSSLDSTLSNARSTQSHSTMASTSSATPSLGLSITTQATSILDDVLYASESLNLSNDGFLATRLALPDEDGQLSYSIVSGQTNNTSRPGLGQKRSSSKLPPQITSTEQIFWCSKEACEQEYARLDAANEAKKSIFKGLIRKIFSRKTAKSTPGDELTVANLSRQNMSQKPIVDNGSVRRYRLSMASATEEAIRGVEAHGIQSCDLLRPRAYEFAAVTPYEYYATLSSATTLSQAKLQNVSNTPKPRLLAKMRSADALMTAFRGKLGRS